MKSLKQYCNINEDNTFSQIAKKLSSSSSSSNNNEEDDTSIEDKLSKINDSNIKQGLLDGYNKLKEQSGDDWNSLKTSVDAFINNVGQGLNNATDVINGYQKMTKLKMSDMIYTILVVTLNGLANKNQSVLNSVGAQNINVNKCAAFCTMICSAIYVKNNALNSIQILNAAGVK